MGGRAITWERRLPGTPQSNFAIAFHFLPRERRDAIRAVYGFCRVADDAVDEARDREEAARALNRVAGLLDDAYAGRGGDPVVERLSRSIRAFELPRGPFDDLLEGVRWDLEGRRYETAADLRAYCYRVASTVGLQCVRIFGCREGACEAYAEELGVALQWTNILRDIGCDLARGRIYLPAESMRSHELSESDLRSPDRSARRRLSALIRSEAVRARRSFAAAAGALPSGERRRVVAGEIMAAVYRDLLGRVERAGAGVLERRIRVPAIRRAALALGEYVRSRLGSAPRSAR
jgi:phytoene synthase